MEVKAMQKPNESDRSEISDTNQKTRKTATMAILFFPVYLNLAHLLSILLLYRKLRTKNLFSDFKML